MMTTRLQGRCDDGTPPRSSHAYPGATLTDVCKIARPLAPPPTERIQHT